jgi:hypothetical protein
MKRHKWNGAKKVNVCVKCGLKKFRVSERLLMAITNHPPYNHYKYIQTFNYMDNKDNYYKTLPECQ